MGMADLSACVLQENMRTFAATREVFCGICTSQYDASHLNTCEVFRKFVDVAVMQCNIHRRRC